MKKLSVLAIITALVLSIALLAGCTKPPANLTDSSVELAEGGVILLSVNPKIAVEYDDTGKVTGIIARNDDALKIVASCEGLIGLETKEVITRLVDAIGQAGYFVEDIDGNLRQITLEIESGSLLPDKTFLDDIIAAVKEYVSANNWSNPVEIAGRPDYEITDYGIFSDGVTDYHNPNCTAEGHAEGCTDYHDSHTDYGHTDYNDTDYGHTDYHHSAPAAQPIPETTQQPVEGYTDYHHDGHTDYHHDGHTDYHHDGYTDYYDGYTDYNTDYGVSDYNDSDYGHSDYHDSDYHR